MAHIITLTGPAHSGKSTISRMFIDCENVFFKPQHVKKFTTRKLRKIDEDVTYKEKIPEECDLVYEQYGVRYGIELNELYQLLEKGITPIIVLNDIRAVEDLKALLGSLVVSVFLYREPAVFENFFAEEKERASEDTSLEEIEKNARIRYEKAQAIYRIYIENIQLFDKVILNVSDCIENTKTKNQVEHIVKNLEKDFCGLREEKTDVS